MRRAYFGLFLLALLFVFWWNQPYFGWSYCVLEGAMRETDFVEKIRPLALRNSRPGTEEQVNLAFDLMKKCVAKRGLHYCRYVGPDEDGLVIKQQDSNKIPSDQAYKYRYIDKKSRVGMFILPYGDLYGSDLKIFSYKPEDGFVRSRDPSGHYTNRGIEKIFTMQICSLGCGCSID